MTRHAYGPLLLEPRLDPKPWGGRRLERFALPLPAATPIGEAACTAMDAAIVGGFAAGRTLGDLVAADAPALLGERGLIATGGRPLFPLLIKLIDAAENLSIQVHPDDLAAGHDGDRLGKTEAWHVLAAEPGAGLYVGLHPDVEADEFAAKCGGDGLATAACLRRLPAVPGTTVLLPAGTTHAIGAGVLLYEVQQPSDVTYRLNDWGRTDAAGDPRELHVDQGFGVLRRELRPDLIPPVNLVTGAGRRQLLVACRLFALERIALAAGEIVPVAAAGSPQALTGLHGGAAVTADDRTAAIGPGATVVLCANAQAAKLRALSPAVVLRAWVPDLFAEIVRPARAAGVADGAIAALASPLPDVRRALDAATG